MSKSEIGKLTAAKCTLLMMSSGLKPKGLRVMDVAELVGAPKTRWNASSLIRWLDVKLLLES